MQPQVTIPSGGNPATAEAGLVSRIGDHLGWAAVVGGFAGTLAMALTGPAILDNAQSTLTWWYSLTLPPAAGRIGNLIVFYLGMAGLSAAWLALGRRLSRSPETRPAELWAVAALWALPLLLGPALFSRDSYSYIAQASLTHFGLNPYSYGPYVLQALGRVQVLNTVAHVWRATVAPYGPLYLALSSVLVGVTGTHLVAGILALRLLDTVGVVLLAVFLPRLARQLGASPSRALWLGLLSPIVLLELIAAGHNDALMVGLLVAGVTLALERHPLAGVAVCALAALVKLPAAAGIPFIAVCWARSQPTHSRQLRALGLAGLVGGGTLLAVTLATGLGFGWLSPSALSTPGSVVVSITPTTSMAAAVTFLLHAVGLGPSTAAAESVARAIGLGGAAVLGFWLLWRVQWRTLVPFLGVLLLAVVLAGPVIWPWYLTWSAVLLATCLSGQRSRVLAGTLAGFGFLIIPAGSDLISNNLGPLIGVAWAAAAVVAWRAWRRRRLSPDEGLDAAGDRHQVEVAPLGPGWAADQLQLAPPAGTAGRLPGP